MASNKAGRGNRMVVGRSMRQPRFERGTFGSGGRRSIQLSYWRVTTWKARNLLWSSYREHPPQPDVSRRAAHHDAKIARLDDPPHALIEQPQPLRTQPKRHLPLLTGREVHAREPGERHHRSRDRRQLVMQVQLHDLITCPRADVLHSTTHRCVAPPGRSDHRGLDRKSGIRERGVAETVSERKQRLAGAVDVVVAATRW